MRVEKDKPVFLKVKSTSFDSIDISLIFYGVDNCFIPNKETNYFPFVPTT